MNILMLVTSVILVAGVMSTGCTQDSPSTSQQSADSSGSPAVTAPDPSQNEPVNINDRPAFNQSAVQNRTPPSGMMMNGTRPSGTPPDGMVNGTRPSGTHPGGMMNGTPPPAPHRHEHRRQVPKPEWGYEKKILFPMNDKESVCRHCPCHTVKRANPLRSQVFYYQGLKRKEGGISPGQLPIFSTSLRKSATELYRSCDLFCMHLMMT